MRAKVHNYSADTSDRQMIHAYLGVLGFLFAYLVYAITKRWDLTIPWWIEAPSGLGYYGLFYLLFKTYLWKCTFVKWLFNLRTPNWNGSYQCFVQSSYDNFASSQDILVNIKQDWDTILISSETLHSSSTSLTGSFSLMNTLSPDFTYEYENHPKALAPTGMNIHKGMATISFENGKLVGEFFTGRGRQTYGKITQK